METITNPHQAHAHFTLPETNKPTKEPTIKLTQEQIDFFKTNGFLSIDRFIDDNEVSYIRDQYDQWFAAKLGREHGNFFDLLSEDTDDKEAVAPQLLWPSIYGKNMTGFDLYSTQMYANAYAISKTLLGEETTFKGDHAILKPPTSNSLPTPWHQDEAYWDPTLFYESLGVWVALQPVSLENGCMQFIAGSHLLFDVLPHHTQNNNPRIHGLEIDNPNEYIKNVISCPLPSGGATFHHCRTLHYTGPNHSNEPRRAYTLQFQCNTKKREQPRLNTWNEIKTTEREKRAKESGWTIRAP
ncbi:unnamed protein product [Rotaria sp. Silwood2]|nr:unnamed protein product [Rotaria sp. Silwood2]CAF2949732.1 unnamed protein product [Rotaria sp. Silwood2]CAF3971359.1 unnamed protein product [Rotaria sp. Silwood2]CAF4458206.1 unnamed protein product [Rotaria sp. Silwood2]